MDLYISDLDGTLLNDKALISDFTKDIINKILNSNINFSVATARTPATVIPILKDLKIKLPIVVMNGAAMYDLTNNKYVNANYIDYNLAKRIHSIVSSSNVSYFTYSLSNNHIFAYYEKTNYFQEKFIKSRIGSPYKTFIKGNITNFDEVLYFFIRDEKNSVIDVYEKIKNINGLYCVLYKDVYDEEIFNLEIYSNKSSKANSIQSIMKEHNLNKLIAFGDNLNDLPMFKIANEGIAVANAVNELKNEATTIIDSNINNGVAKYLSSIL